MRWKLRHAFDFQGRLSRADQMRLERRLIIISIPGILGPMFLLIAGAPRIVAVLPALLLVPVVVAAVASNVRRLHDVGRHAHRVYLKRLIFSACLVAALTAILVLPDLPEDAAWTLAGLAVTAFLLSFFVRDLGWTEWRRGDSGPNRFGPPPE